METGRYTQTPVNDRACFHCGPGVVESETHALVNCPLYRDIHRELGLRATTIEPEFSGFTAENKLSFVLANKLCVMLVPKPAKTFFANGGQRYIITNFKYFI